MFTTIFMVLVYFCRDSSVQKLHDSFVGVLADPYFSIPSEEANICLQAARAMVHYFSEPKKEHQEFAIWLVTTLKALVESTRSKAGQNINREKLWIKFHELTSSQDFISKWKGFVKNVSITVPPLLYQHVTDEIFEGLIKKFCGSLTANTTAPTEDTVVLSNEEENIIHYVGGYVIQELKKDKCNSSMLPLLESLTDLEKRPTIDAAQQWITSVNRGGLTKITDAAFQCFCDIEVSIRRFLNVNNTRDMNEGFRTKVTSAILSDDNLLFNWTFASELIVDQDVADRCLEKIVHKWFVIRGFSFSDSMMEIYKQESKKGTGKSKSLRCKLYTDDMS